MTESSSSSSSSSKKEMTTFDLSLDDIEEHALCFLSLPGVSRHLLAFGGDNGEIVCIDRTKGKSKVIRRWEDDGVRSMAASPSGQYVVVGLEDGSTQIYVYAKDEITSTFHPFVGKLSDKEKEDASHHQQEDSLLSQSDTLLLSPHRGEKMVLGPVFETVVKDLLFLDEEYLGIAHETGFCIVSIQDILDSSKVTTHYLEEEQKDAHHESGCRGLAWMPKTRTLASLAMDGRLCLWDCSSSTTDPSKWKLLKREQTKAITKVDPGEMYGDAWDRSCKPVVDYNKTLLALPGEPYWQVRSIDEKDGTTVNDQTLLETTLNGHTESMVVLRASPHANDPYWISTGRDGRVIVWKVEKDETDGTFQFEVVRTLAENLSPAPTDMFWDEKDDSLYVGLPGDATKVAVWKGREALGLPPLLHQGKKQKKSEKQLAASDKAAAATTTKTASSAASTMSPATKKSSSTTSTAATEPVPSPSTDNKASPVKETSSDKAPASPDKGTSSADEGESPLKDFSSSPSSPPKPTSSSPAAKSPSAGSDKESSPVGASVSNTSSPSSSPAVDKDDATAAPADKEASPVRKRLQKMNDKDDDDDDDDVVFSQGSPKAPSPPASNPSPTIKRSDLIDDMAVDDDDGGFPDGGGGDDNDGLDDGDGPSGTSPARDNVNGGHGDDDDGDDGMDDEEDDEFGHSAFDPMANRVGLMSAGATGTSMISWPKPQPPFAPSSTPLDLPRRYMCWNHVGSVVLRRGEAGVSRTTVDIDFNDSAFRRPLSFTDNMGFIVGSLGEDGGIFASDLADDDDDVDKELQDVVGGVQVSEKTIEALRKSRAATKGVARGSTIYFHRYETFASLRDKDWYLTLPDGERVVGCASGEGWAAVVTSRRFLRLFSSGGNQGQVLWLDGEPVTIVGRSRFLAVFYHQSMPLPDGTQKLGYLFYDTMTNRVIGKGTVGCISTGSRLRWAGFSKDLSLVAMDEDGMMSMLISSEPANNWEWMPVLDTVGLRKSSEDSFWPVQVSEGKLVCVPLKGGNKYPDATRRPITSSLALRLQFARGPLTQTNALEELSVRASMALSQRRIINDICMDGEVDEKFEEDYNTLSAQVDKVTLKMFAAIVAAGKLERAMDLIDRLHLEKSYELAMTIADRHRKLVDLIDEARDRKFGGGGGDEHDDGGYEDDEVNDDYESSPPPYEGTQDFRQRQQQQQRITPDAGFSRKTKRSYEDQHAVPQSRAVRRKQAFA